MAFYKSVLIFTFIVCVNSKIEPPFSPCNKDDLVCLRTAKENFIANTYEGVEQIDVKQIDPLTIVSMDIIDEDSELALHFNNTSVTGLKNLKISDFKLDVDKKLVELEMTSELTILGEVDVEMTKLQKTFKGRYSATATAKETVEYTYDINEVNGTEYFELGPETSTCDIVEEPIVSLKVTLQDDTDKEIYAKKPQFDKAALRKKTICQVMNAVTETIMHNLRAAAKAYPKSAFVNDD